MSMPGQSRRLRGVLVLGHGAPWPQLKCSVGPGLPAGNHAAARFPAAHSGLQDHPVAPSGLTSARPPLGAARTIKTELTAFSSRALPGGVAGDRVGAYFRGWCAERHVANNPIPTLVTVVKAVGPAMENTSTERERRISSAVRSSARSRKGVSGCAAGVWSEGAVSEAASGRGAAVEPGIGSGSCEVLSLASMRPSTEPAVPAAGIARTLS